MQTKVCTKCKEEKTIDNFPIRNDNGKTRNECKECIVKYNKQYRKNNKEKLNQQRKEYVLTHKEQRRKTIKKYYEKNKDKIKKYHKELYEKNKEKNRKYHRQYYYEHKKDYRQRKKEKLQNDLMFKIKEQVRKCVWTAFNRKGFRKNGKTEQILGCDFKTFYKHLLKTFKENYGYEWDGIEKVHIDHIKPLKECKNQEEIIKLCHYTNLQLLKAKDNLNKSSKLDWKLKKEEE